MIDFDEIDDWFPTLSAKLELCVLPEIRRAVAKSKPKYFEDAREKLLKLAKKAAIIDATLDWLRSDTIIAYHGTRLTDEEVESVRTEGLLPLEPTSRRKRLVRALSGHPRWSEAEPKVDGEIQSLADGKGGNRKHQVHLTMSRACLINYGTYLVQGSEFDYHVAYGLLGKEGVDLLTRDGNSCIVSVAVPGSEALSAAHPFFSVEDLRRRGEIPNLVGEFLQAWSFRLARPGFQSRTLNLDFCLFFREKIPPEKIVSIEFTNE